MSGEENWVLPASIPFADLKGRDLEECVYWLLDSMGAKDLEWRVGGASGGAADQGRDLEAKFYITGRDGEMEPQRWWIECKGRGGTVEPEAVRSAVNTALAVSGLDYLVVVTNTQFSNPTRDWVREWQNKHPLPKVKLWDSAQLERMLSRQPEVVARLFSTALSLHGRIKAMESRFWNKLELTGSDILKAAWAGKDDLELSPMSIFSAAACELANGSIVERPWLGTISDDILQDVLSMSFANLPYFIVRSARVGGGSDLLIRTYAYLLLSCIDRFSAEGVAEAMLLAMSRGGEPLPDHVLDFVLMPVMDQLFGELQDVCVSDCERISTREHSTLGRKEDQVSTYWFRLERNGLTEERPEHWLLLERNDATCRVGFALDASHSCPLFGVRPTPQNVKASLKVLKRIVSVRKAQARNTPTRAYSSK